MTSPPPESGDVGGGISLTSFDVPMGDESIVVELDQLREDDDFNDTIGLILESHPPTLRHFVMVIEEAWRIGKFALAFKSLEDVLDRPGANQGKFAERDRVALFCMLANYNMALARRAPKFLISSPRTKPLTHETKPNHPESKLRDNAPPRIKEEYWKEAENRLRAAERIERNDKRIMDGQAALLLARGKLDDAGKLFEIILSAEPTHLMALMGRARVNFARRAYRAALKSYQTVLSLAPTFLPDPRIGIGLCLWNLNERDRARKAWERSLVVHPESSSNSALLLLALVHINASRDPANPGGDEGRSTAYTKGIEYTTAAFKRDNTSSAAAGILSTQFLYQSRYEAALKLAERAIQFADTRVLLAEGHLHVARCLHAQGNDNAMTDYAAAVSANPEHTVANLAVAQTLLRVQDFPAAMNIFETILRRQPRCIEALVSLAAIHTHLAFTYHSIADSTAERKKAKELYDQVIRIFQTGKDTATGDSDSHKTPSVSARVREIQHDADLFVEIAKLWSDENSLDRSLQAYRQSASIREEAALDAGTPAEEAVPAEVLNNIAVLEYHKGDSAAAQVKFEAAIGEVGHSVALAGGVLTDALDAVLTAVTYNLGVVYEAVGDVEKAQGAYGQILSRHCEFIDAKARLALLAMKAKEMDRAHNLIKEALSSQPVNLEIRALYTYFLSQTAPPKMATDFTVETLKMVKQTQRADVYALCAAGMLHYIQARESKDPSKEAAVTRSTKFLKAAQYYDSALKLDPFCAFAAQGIAISIAEGTIGTGVEVVPGTPAMLEPAQKAKNSRDALTILTKVKESIHDGSVYVNIGHCYFARDEWERAIESYETASKRFFKGKNVNTLLYLARSWYHKANKDQSYSDLRAALKEAQAALALLPSDLAIIFNIAIIQQKGIEILFELPMHRRTLSDINEALRDCEESQKLFEQLKNDKTEHPPYAREMPGHRVRYGQSLLNRSVDVIVQQKAHEHTEASKVEAARQAREAEKERQAEEEAKRQAEIARQAHDLAEQRRLMREEAALYAQTRLAGFESEEEDKKEKKKKAPGGKKRAKAKKEEDESTGSEDEKPKPKKKKSKVKAEVKAEDSEGGAAEQMDVDSDGEEAVRGSKRKSGRSGKAFKSTEFISSESEED